MSRMDELLVSTAQQLKAGRAPLNEAWLGDNDVTLNECMDLADTLATAIHVYRATFKLALQLAGNDAKKEHTLSELVRGMSIRQGGPVAILAEALRLEEAADATD